MQKIAKHPDLSSEYRRSFTGVKRLERDVDHSRPSVA